MKYCGMRQFFELPHTFHLHLRQGFSVPEITHFLLTSPAASGMIKRGGGFASEPIKCKRK
jgi:hypothetical protein